jgi:hypothetical protein
MNDNSYISRANELITLANEKLIRIVHCVTKHLNSSVLARVEFFGDRSIRDDTNSINSDLYVVVLTLHLMVNLEGHDSQKAKSCRPYKQFT